MKKNNLLSRLKIFNKYKKEFLTPTEEQHIVQAIAAAELGNRGEVRLHLEARCSQENVLQRAQEVFFKLGMDRTSEGTGVLLYIAHEDRKAAVYAGPGIYGAAQKGFWDEIIATVANGFAAGDSIKGLLRAIENIGDLLRKEVPGDDIAGNELPNEISS